MNVNLAQIHLFLIIRVTPEGGIGSWRRVVVYEVANGMITAGRVFEDDPVAAEAFFSRGKEVAR